MATDLCCEYVLDLSTDLKMNEGGGGDTPTATTIRPTSIRGLDGKPIRRTIWPQGASNGAILGTGRFGGRLIAVEGEIIVVSGGELVTPADNLTTYLTGVNTLVKAWTDGLEAVLNTAFNFVFTPTGLSQVTLSVVYGFEGAEFQSVPSPDMSEPVKVSYGLVAASG